MGPGWRLWGPVALVSAALVGYQIALVQILAATQWQPFTATVVALALLGFGLSGSVLGLARPWFLAHAAVLMPLLAAGFALAMPAGVALAQWGPVRFDSFLLFARAGHAWRLAATGLAALGPFLLGALAVGLAFTAAPACPGRLYAATLLGSAAGGPLALALAARARPEAIPGLLAVLPLAAALAAVPRRPRLPALAAGLATFLAAAWLAWHPPALAPSQFKAVRRALDLPGAVLAATVPGPYGLFQVVDAPSLRYAPGVSLLHPGPFPRAPAAFLDGDPYGPLLPWDPAARDTILDHAPDALPYVLGPRPRVLVLDARTGPQVIQALGRGARRVDALVQVPAAADLLARWAPAPVAVHRTAPRPFLAGTGPPWDLVVLPPLEASGLRALEPDALLTVEAVAQMLDRLAPDGVLAATCPVDQPPRLSLKLLATLARALADRGLDPATRLAAVRGWATFTVTAQATPVARAAADRVRRFCAGEAFDPLLLPGLAPGERDRHHALPDGAWLRQVDAVLAGHPEPGPFNLAPATDDRPFPHQFLTRRALPALAAAYGARAVPYFELAGPVLLLAAALVTVLALLLVLLPGALAGGPGRARVMAYFGGLGAGYMLLEMSLIQRFTVHLGHPVPAAAAVIGLLLLGSGLGSLAAARRWRPPGPVAAAVAVLALAAALLLPPALRSTLALPLAGRAATAALVLVPLAVPMGMPFPLALAAIPRDQVPWAWGVNGCLSVVCAPLGTILAVAAGFTWVTALAAGAYAMAFLAARGAGWQPDGR